MNFDYHSLKKSYIFPFSPNYGSVKNKNQLKDKIRTQSNIYDGAFSWK